MEGYDFTSYFENEVLRKRPYIQKDWCIRALEQPLRTEIQPDDARGCGFGFKFPKWTTAF